MVKVTQLSSGVLIYCANMLPTVSEIYVWLDNVRSALNVGSIFRTADGAGVTEIVLGGYTPTPTDRFGRTQEEIKKTSLGASELISWEKVEDKDIEEKIRELKEQGFEIVSVEQTDNSISIYDFKPSSKVCYIFGNEIDGVRQEILYLSDKIIEIPMKGKKESLNVGVSVGIVLFR